MTANNLDSKISSTDVQIQEPLLRTMPRMMSEFALWSIAAVAAAPLAMAAGYIATAEAANGAFVLPFIAVGACKILRECLAA